MKTARKRCRVANVINISTKYLEVIQGQNYLPELNLLNDGRIKAIVIRFPA